MTQTTKVTHSHNGRLCQYNELKWLAWQTDFQVNDSGQSERIVFLTWADRADANQWAPLKEIQWLE